MTAPTQTVARLFVIGPLRLTDGAGNSVTPRSKKACALLALLALAPRCQRTRVWLRDKLWSESCERKSSTSLRQLLFELRRDLGGLFDAMLEVDRHAIMLRRDAVWIDIRNVETDPNTLTALRITPDTDLLEGIDVADEEFEDWLLLERQAWHNRATDLFAQITDLSTASAARSLPQAALFAETIPEPRLRVGVLPNIQQGCDADTAFVADHLVEGIVKNLRELHPLDIYDLRDTSGPSDGLVGSGNTDHLLRVRALQIRHTLTLTFFLYSARNMSLEWSQSIQTSVDEALNFDSYVLAGFINQNVDRISRHFEQRQTTELAEQPKPIVAAMSALNMMFRLDDRALENAEAMLRNHADTASSGLFDAMRAYAASFKVGENLGRLQSDDVNATSDLARGALSGNPFNSISLACLAHAMGYVFHEHGLASDLLDKALRLNPNQAFVWDHYALNRMYVGDYEAAHKAAERAVYLGSFSPLSYSYDTTLAMTSTMLGRNQLAIASSRNALRKQPNFAAAMRYLLVNLSKTDREEEARSTYAALLKRDPDFADPEIQKTRFRLVQKGTETDLISTIKKFT
ncbi:tetratricopeptide repeat protein [Phaeobacter sp. B1627]|uniref:tetratricopeptide repeat protein n=1 Tax=Phaeobacter sp. B1627 TaxID=2583809 RepID=UPI00111BC510|nr:tetratricopeptide repeat protein [Phaeobacter sp. B1627]TNJ40619.1 tetratricopeptide repeat protein [Phaeobacter sp. B1627]